MANISLLGALVFYLVLASSLATVIIQGSENSQVDYSLGIDVSQIKQSSVLNMSDNATDSYLGSGTRYSLTYEDSWRFTDKGLEKVSNYGEGFTIPYVVKQSNNEYVNNYYIDNPNHFPYWVYVKKDSGGIIGSIVGQLGNVILYFDEQGVHYVNNIPFMPDNNYYGVNFLNDESAKITTVFNEDSDIKYLKVYYNDELVIQSYTIPSSVPSVLYRYGGMEGYLGLVVKLIIGSYATGNDVTSTLNTMEQFITMLFTILLWNLPEQYMPFYLNMLMIKVPLFIIVGIIVTIIRGN